jgi:phosphoribosyl 1,2-cyclic phosphodiesterase
MTLKKGSMLSVQSFGSSSKGNCTCVWDEETIVLIDCGFYASHIQRSLRKIGRRLSDVSGVLITHMHGDHFSPSAANEFLSLGVPMYCSQHILEPLFRRFGKFLNPGYEQGFTPLENTSFTINSLTIKGFEVPHDSEGGCFGYSIEKEALNKQAKIAIATDIAHTADGTAEHFVDSDIIVIEANHDYGMLRNSGRPYVLINRIITTGHLSNDQCAEFLGEVIKSSKKKPLAVLLAHISQECNSYDKAAADIANYLSQEKISLPLFPTFPDKASEIFSVSY